nr:putative ribonuclease H-like domain-containing protein [Tanacetum cinerariifolium]
MLKDNALVELRKKFKKAKKERDELKVKLEKFQTSSKNLSKILASQITNKTGLGYDNQVFNSTMFDCGELISSDSDVSMPPSPVHDRYQSGEGYHAVPPPYTGTFLPPNLIWHIVPTAILTRSRLVPLTTARPFAAAVPQTKVQHQRPTNHGVNKGNPQQALKDKGVINSGCSRHITRNISYLSDFEAINGGYVAFGGNPKGGKITGKDTKCIILSSNFKLPDDNHVLLRVPRENNMYNVDLKNIVPSEDLTCLFAKATFDESNLWHRRLGHINFKIMNKLVKDLNQFCGIKWIKMEFSVARTPQQNGITERKNKTFIEAAMTMLVDSLLPISFWAEVVNTAYYVQNMVLVTKPHNKTPYELLLSRTPSIGFMRPFSCHVTILNILDTLGKFDGKADEGFLVGYSVSSMAFRVFNSRTKIIQEILHINFLENQPNVEGSRPIWLFDIDTLTQSMNFQPVVAGNQPNSSASIQENFDAGKVGEGNVQQHVLFPLWSTGSKDPLNTNVNASFEVKEPESKVHVSLSSCDKTKKHDDETKKEAKGKSHVELSTGVQNLCEEFEDYSSNSTNSVNAASTLVTAVELSPNSTKTFSAAGPSNNVVRSKFEFGGKSSFVDPSKYPDDLDMPALEDITYSDDEENGGAEADFSNLETSITVSPFPTLRVHKDHPVNQIIGDLSFAYQIRSMTRMVKDQEPKRVHQALKDPSWIEAIQEELLQFKLQKVWVLIDLPKGKRAIGFKDPDYPDKVYKVVKELYGLHQAPRAWYETLANYLLENDLCKAFEKLRKDKFQMSSVGELTFFLGLQVKQKQDGIFISQDKYVAEILRKFGLIDGKSASSLIDTKKPLLKDPDGEDVDLHTYRSMIVTLKASHLHAVKRIFRYLKGKLQLGLWYPKDLPFTLVAYSDSDMLEQAWIGSPQQGVVNS